MSNYRSRTLSFGQQIFDLWGRDCPEIDREQLGTLILDYLGVVAFGANLPVTRKLVEWGRTFAGGGKASLLASECKVPTSVAALVSAAAAHGFELDDTHDESMSHPGAVVLSAAIAVGTEVAANTHQLHRAVLCGYEAMTRIGMAANAKLVMKKGIHPTPLFGCFGSATTASLLYGLDLGGLMRAWGHALSLAAGSMQFSEEAEGNDVKRVHAGFAAQNGILAAQLAASNISAPEDSLSGKYGLFSLLAVDPQLQHLDGAQGGPLQIHQVSIKPYACCRMFHSAIDAVLELQRGGRAQAAKIRDIQVEVAASVLVGRMNLQPTSSMSAQYSLPFAIGATIACGPEDYAAYKDDRVSDTKVIDLAKRVHAISSTKMEDNFPRHISATVRVTLNDGSSHERSVTDSRGTATNPLTLSEVRKKALVLTRSETTSDLKKFSDLIWSERPARALAEVLNAKVLDRLPASPEEQGGVPS